MAVTTVTVQFKTNLTQLQGNIPDFQISVDLNAVWRNILEHKDVRTLF